MMILLRLFALLLIVGMLATGFVAGTGLTEAFRMVGF